MTLVERSRWHRIRNYLVGLAVTVLVLVLGLVGFVVVKSLVDDEKTQERQRTLAPFYVAPDGWEDASPGDVLRRERLGEGGDLGHMKAGFASAPLVFTWLQQRFAGVPLVSTCGSVLPVAPISS